MRTVAHRDMRNNSGDLLRRVEAGESVQISNNGRVVAMMVPMVETSLQTLVARGQARRSRSPLSSLATIRRAAAPATSAAIIEDVRGRW